MSMAAMVEVQVSSWTFNPLARVIKKIRLCRGVALRLHSAQRTKMTRKMTSDGLTIDLVRRVTEDDIVSRRWEPGRALPLIQDQSVQANQLIDHQLENTGRFFFEGGNFRLDANFNVALKFTRCADDENDSWRFGSKVSLNCQSCVAIYRSLGDIGLYLAVDSISRSIIVNHYWSNGIGGSKIDNKEIYI